MENLTQETTTLVVKKKGPIIITVIIAAALVLFGASVLLNQDKNFILSGDSVLDTMNAFGYELKDTTSFEELSDISKAKWGYPKVVDGTRWTYQNGNETILIRQREFQTPIQAALQFMASQNMEDMHFSSKENFGDNAMSGIFFNQMYQSALVFLVQDGNRIIEVAYSNKGLDYDPVQLEKDRTALRAQVKKLFGVWF